MFFLRLLKLKVSSLIFYNCSAGYLISCSFIFDPDFFFLLLGLLFLIFSSSVLNIIYESNIDKLMHRTKNRIKDLSRLQYGNFILLFFFFF